MKYVYPAVFTKDASGYLVNFPDVENCFTDGATLNEALDMAQDALNLMLMTMEDEKIPAAPPSEMQAIQCGADQFVSLISADTDAYRKLYGNYAVKKTLSIPAWLNTLAEKNGINFSFILQKALKAELDIS
ncbi:MAG: type II toxin-antitoxin system HicB family antitoxin [Oscillospiraceae bacterium]|nr:type II toxin-antitoxin system HicB family antitoxin [Oscillospiraceae bacterium]